MPSDKQITYVADAIDFALGDIKKARSFADRMDLIKDVVRKALTAAEQAEPVPAARSGAVKVKALEWYRRSSTHSTITSLFAEAVGLTYQAWGGGAWGVRSSEEGQHFLPKEGERSIEAAKAAAQADYERRILAALEPAEPSTDAEIVMPSTAPNAKLKAMWDDYQAVNRQKKQAYPETDAEPVAYAYVFDGECEQLDWGTDYEDDPALVLLYTRPPESRLPDALDRYEAAANHVGGCGDSNCVVVRPVGQRTNGGCRCYTDKMKAQRMMMAGQMLSASVRDALAQEDGR